MSITISSRSFKTMFPSPNLISLEESGWSYFFNKTSKNLIIYKKFNIPSTIKLWNNLPLDIRNLYLLIDIDKHKFYYNIIFNEEKIKS